MASSTTSGITAIYDIIWHASTHPIAPLCISTVYTGSRILFSKELVLTDSPSVAQYEYSAVLKFEGWEAVYRCDESLFRNFDISSLPPPSTTHLIPITPPSPDFMSLCSSNPTPAPNPHAIQLGPLHLKFISSKDPDGYPFLHFRIQATTELLDDKGEGLQMCAVGWAKRREFDDECPGVETCLSVGERERLGGRKEIDMDGLERDGNGLEEGEVSE